MSVANIFVGSDHVLLLSDTLEYKKGRASGLCTTKTHIAPNGRLAWTFRGSVAVEELLADRIDDHADARLAAADIAKHTDETMPANGVPGGFELTLASFDAGPAAVRVRRREGEAKATVEVLSAGTHLLPNPPGFTPPPIADEALMIRLALAQWKAQRTFGLKLCIGGLIHLTRIDAAGIVQRLAGEYPDYPLTARRFGDPNMAAETHAAA